MQAIDIRVEIYGKVFQQRDAHEICHEMKAMCNVYAKDFIIGKAISFFVSCARCSMFSDQALRSVSKQLIFKELRT